jgi:hypothetical protein
MLKEKTELSKENCTVDQLFSFLLMKRMAKKSSYFLYSYVDVRKETKLFSISWYVLSRSAAIFYKSIK